MAGQSLSLLDIPLLVCNTIIGTLSLARLADLFATTGDPLESDKQKDYSKKRWS